MKRMTKNKALKRAVESIKNNPYTIEVLDVSPVMPVPYPEQQYASLQQGQYETYVKFTSMQQIIVTYKNEYFGVIQDTVLAGFDAVKYHGCNNGMYEGEYMSNWITDIKFIGEYATSRRSIETDFDEYGREKWIGFSK